MKTAENRKHAAAIAAACIALAALVVLGTVIISYWNTPIAKTESRTMQAMLLQEDGSAEPCTVLISGISYHYLFRNHADSFEANDPGGVFVNGSRIMDSLILPSDIDSDWMFWQDDMLWCDAAGEQFIALLHAGARHRPGGDEAGSAGPSAVAAGDACRRCGNAAPDRTVFEITGRHSAPSHWGGAFVSFPGRVIPRSEATWESREAGFGFASACQNPQPILRDCHGPSRGLAMTNLTV